MSSNPKTVSVIVKPQTDSDRLKAFQAQAAAGRAPKARPVDKTATKVVAAILYDGNHSSALPHSRVALTPAESRMWLERHQRQEAWTAACDVLSEYAENNAVAYLKSVARGSAALGQGMSRALDTLETTYLGAVTTAGPMWMRKTFWKFVAVRESGFTPQDLASFVDVYAALDRLYEAQNAACRTRGTTPEILVIDEAATTVMAAVASAESESAIL